MPITLPAPWLAEVGRQIWDLLPPQRITHFVVLASGGVGLALAVVAAASGRPLGSVSVAKRDYSFSTPELTAKPEDQVVVVDNSLHTGDSIRSAIDGVRRRGLDVEAVVTLLDGAHQCETLVRDDIARSFGVQMLSCGRWADRHAWSVNAGSMSSAKAE